MINVNSQIEAIYPLLKYHDPDNDGLNILGTCYGFYIKAPASALPLTLSVNGLPNVTLTSANYDSLTGTYKYDTGAPDPDRNNKRTAYMPSGISANGYFQVSDKDGFNLYGRYYSNVSNSNGAVHICGTKNLFYVDDLGYSTDNDKCIKIAVNSNPQIQSSIDINWDWEVHGTQYFFDLGSYNGGQTYTFNQFNYPNKGTCSGTVDDSFKPTYYLETQDCSFAIPSCVAGTNAPNIQTTVSNACPSNTFDLGTLTYTNKPTDSTVVIKYYSDNALTTEITNLNVGAGTYYAAYVASDGCKSPSTSVAVSITNCCTPVSGGNITGNSNSTVNVNEIYSVTGLVGTTPFTYLWSVIQNGTIVSGSTTDTVTVTPTANSLKLKVEVSNCGNTTPLVIEKEINVKMFCNITIPIKFGCFTVTSITGTLENITETDRVISWTAENVTFKAEPGINNYVFKITDSNNIIHTIKIKNVTC